MRIFFKSVTSTAVPAFCILIKMIRKCSGGYVHNGTTEMTRYNTPLHAGTFYSATVMYSKMRTYQGHRRLNKSFMGKIMALAGNPPSRRQGVLKSWSIMTYPSDPIIVKLKGRKMQTRRQWREVRSKGEAKRDYGSAWTTKDPKNLMLKMVMSHLGCGSIESDSSNSHSTTTIPLTRSHYKDIPQQVNTATPYTGV